MSDFWTDITEFDPNTIVEDTVDKQSHQTDKLVTQQQSVLAVEQEVETTEFETEQEDETAIKQERETAVEQELETAVEQELETAVEQELETAVEQVVETTAEKEADIAVEQEAEIAVEQEAEIAVEQEAEIAVEQEAEIVVEQEEEIAVQRRNDEPAAQEDVFATHGKNTDGVVKDSHDSKTSGTATKKGNVSFEINDSNDNDTIERGSTNEKTKPKKYKLTPDMLNRMKSLLLQKKHYCSEDDMYVEDLIDAVECELMGLPKKKKIEGTKTKHLTKNKIRSINKQRRDICLNMEFITSSINSEFENIDECLLNLRQASNDFNAEFNQPHAPVGEPHAVSHGMGKLFMQIKENLPIFQDCFKEVKHCTKQFIKADKSLTDVLQNTIQTYFGDRLKGKHIPRVRYDEVLKTFNKSNRQHCHFDVDVCAMNETSDADFDNDKH